MLKTIAKPTAKQEMLFRAVDEEIAKRTNIEILSDAARYMIVSDFVKKYDFSNSALSHKSPGGWAKLILSEIGYTEG